MMQNSSLAGRLAAIDAQRRAEQFSQPFTQLMGRTQPLPRQLVIGGILLVALLAFEIFNFDTTRYALRNLLGDVSFATLQWATILAVAFCAIDFAGLIRLFTPDDGNGMPKEVWYLMGAWLLGATMNAMMTWWAVSLTLLNHDLGNEVLSREQLLHTVPIFVAVLVWLTRILFIGALTVASEQIAAWRNEQRDKPAVVKAVSHRPSAPAVAFPDFAPVTDEAPAFLARRQRPSMDSEMFSDRRGRPEAISEAATVIERPRRESTSRSAASVNEPFGEPVREPVRQPAREPVRENDRVRQRPPMPNGASRFAFGGAQAKGRGR
jgi:hypothetical protein